MHLEMGAAQIDVEGYLKAVRGDDFWRFAAQQWHGLYEMFVPYDTGTLYRQVEIAPGEIHHSAPYAQHVYGGDFNFHKDVHPFATGHWDTAAAPTQLPLLVAAMQAYVDAGRLKFE